MFPLKSYRVTYPYGVKNARYAKGYHTGVDLVSDEYTIYCAVSGTVIVARYAPGQGADPAGWGNYIIVRCGQYDVIYAHLSSCSVTDGQQVTGGAVIGKMGSTGQSTGLHLHFEVRKGSWTNIQDIDPLKWLEGEKRFMDLILVGRGPDERAAGYLADYLKAPVSCLDAVKHDDIEAAQNVYMVGGSIKPVDRAILISGKDRFETCQKVLEFIARGGK